MFPLGDVAAARTLRLKCRSYEVSRMSTLWMQRCYIPRVTRESRGSYVVKATVPSNPHLENCIVDDEGEVIVKMSTTNSHGGLADY